MNCICISSDPEGTESDDDKEEVEWFLTGPDNRNDDIVVRKVKVDSELGKNLKPYQRDGVEFLWRNCFSDFNCHKTGDQSRIGGCILAHYMGLGKSLTTITVLHTALTSSSMVTKKKKKRLLHTVLLIAPANTLSNWVDEVDKWTEDLETGLHIKNLGSVTASSRKKTIKKWKKEGGIMVLSDSMFQIAADDITSEVQPDVLVLDEAHTMLKHSGNKRFKTLLNIQTKRKILLTGTPLQNNVSEYFRMIEYIRPGVIGVESEADFEREYRAPIELGLPSDASDTEKLVSMELQSKLKTTLDPYVHRKSASVLQNYLPPIHDNLLYIQKSKLQESLLHIHKRMRKKGTKSKNFFSHYSDIAPILNHPGTLKLERAKRGKNMSWKSEDDVKDKWFMQNGLTPKDFDSLEEAKRSPKMVILAHIVAWASRNNDKVLIYSKDLKTLDIVQLFLGQADWKSSIESLRVPFKDTLLGGWEKGTDYVRIDGSVNSGRRGDLVDQFNDKKDIKAFLISSLAGGIGINLCEANVVVIMDNHFNPAVSKQCVSRAHRLGQRKPVYCFRLAIKGTLEEKIYARSVTKDGVAIQVVDGKFSEMLFKAEEMDLEEVNTIMICHDCGKERRLIDQEPPSGSCKWVCSMNTDMRFNKCTIPQERKLWKQRMGPMPVLNNPILKHVVGVVNTKTRRTALVLDYLPVQIIQATDLCCEDAINKLKDDISGESQTTDKNKIVHQNGSRKKKAKTNKGKSCVGGIKLADQNMATDEPLPNCNRNNAEAKSNDKGNDTNIQKGERSTKNPVTAPGNISIPSSEEEISSDSDENFIKLLDRFKAGQISLKELKQKMSSVD